MSEHAGTYLKIFARLLTAPTLYCILTISQLVTMG
jgi:hypothetical protein